VFRQTTNHFLPKKTSQFIVRVRYHPPVPAEMFPSRTKFQKFDAHQVGATPGVAVLFARGSWVTGR
jgi:hypothetical protein